MVLNLNHLIVTQACVSISEPGDVSYLQLLSSNCSDVSSYSRGGEYQLLDWLEKVTFPTEARFAEADFARNTYRSVIRRSLSAGVSLDSIFSQIAPSSC